MPDGSAESFTDDVDWVALNLEHTIEQWEATRVFEKAAVQGTLVIPWIRLAHIADGDDINVVRARLGKLVFAALRWDSNIIIPNYEDEADHITPAEVELVLEETEWRDDPEHVVGWSTQAWLPSDPDFSPFTEHGDSVLLQIFPKDLRWAYDADEISTKMGDCILHARLDKGFTYVGVTYQTYDQENGNSPDLYNTTDYMHSTYPGNVIKHGEWPNWYQ